MAKLQEVRLTLSDRCDGVLPNADGQRILQGRIERVASTDVFCVIVGRHVPLEEILSVKRPHYTDSPASDPVDPLEREASAAGVGFLRQPEPKEDVS